MPYQYFLAVPLLIFDDDEFTEVRFEHGPKNWDELKWPESDVAEVVASFAHHAFLRKDRKLAFSDLQGEFLVQIWYKLIPSKVSCSQG